MDLNKKSEEGGLLWIPGDLKNNKAILQKNTIKIKGKMPIYRKNQRPIQKLE